jgi:acetyltransferase-like isoleucine patch superfamily enzyme
VGNLFDRLLKRNQGAIPATEERSGDLDSADKMPSVEGLTIGAGTRIDPTAFVSAAGGSILLGQKVQIRRHATVDATSGSIEIADGTILFPYSMVMSYPNGRIRIGRDCTINPFTVLYGHGGLDIGNQVRIATHTVVISANHVFSDPDAPIASQGLTKKGVVIEDDVWIGANVTILDGVRLARRCVVAAGSVVNKSFEAGSVIAGVPARVVKHRGDPD